MLPLRELSQRLPLRELSLLASLVGASGVLVWRVQEGRTAVTAKKILIPPIGMASGFCMFLVPDFRFPLLWAACAFLLGAVVFAYPLLRTSRLVRDGEVIMMQRSNIFFVVVIALAAIRILAHSTIDRFVDVRADGRAILCAGLWNDPALARAHVLRVSPAHRRINALTAVCGPAEAI